MRAIAKMKEQTQLQFAQVLANKGLPAISSKFGRTQLHARYRQEQTGTTVAALCIAFILAGCQLPQRTFEPPVDPASLSDEQFLHYLATVPAVSVDEAARAVLMLDGPTGRWPTPADRLAELRRRGAIRDQWRLRPGDMLSMGTFAHMIRVMFRLPRSINEVAFGPAGIGERRYALRTCIHAGVLPPARSTDPVRGGELLSALAKVE